MLAQVFISVRLLYEIIPRAGSRRLAGPDVKSQRAQVGWLVTCESPDFPGTRSARLLDDAGRDVLPPLQRAFVDGDIKGRAGMCVRGMVYVAKGRKQSIPAKQAWWCQAPPRVEPLAEPDD